MYVTQLINPLLPHHHFKEKTKMMHFLILQSHSGIMDPGKAA
jgi:hypothetical protein